MYPYLETIRLEAGAFQHLPYHNRRYNHTRKALFRVTNEEDLSPYLERWIQNQHIRQDLKYKVRVLFTNKIKRIEIAPYSIRPVHTLQIVHSEHIAYPYKSTQRDDLDALYAQRGKADDILICKNGLLSDSWTANLALFDGNQWHTPSTPLLRGTTRDRLLEEGVLLEKSIPVSKLQSYQKVRLVNAMFTFEESPEIPIENIRA